MKRKVLPLSTFPAIVLAMTGCSSGQTKQDDAVAQLTQRIAALEARVSALSGKTTEAKTEPSQAAPAQAQAVRTDAQKLDPVPSITDAEVVPPPSENSGTPVDAPVARQDPEAGFTSDEAVQSFRKGMILFQAQKYPEAILSYSSFLERFPDHPLAGSAQYYIGESYLKHGDLKLALEEFRRVLTSYDRSPRIPDTLRELSLVEDKLNMTNQADHHRQLLTSLFPQSPAAADLPKIDSHPNVPPVAAASGTATVPSEKTTAPAAGGADEKLDEPPPTAPITPAETQ